MTVDRGDQRPAVRHPGLVGIEIESRRALLSSGNSNTNGIDPSLQKRYASTTNLDVAAPPQAPCDATVPPAFHGSTLPTDDNALPRPKSLLLRVRA